MSQFTTIVALSALILVVLGARAFFVVRKEKNTKRGSEPGTGYHEIEANYFSGGGGGGHQGSFKVPKDPQEYARQFVPKTRD